MVDPFSIATAVFGMTAGAMTLLLTTIENFHKKRHDYIECRDRLSHIRLHMERSLDILISWRMTWTRLGQAWPESSYIYLWGATRWEHLKQRYSLVHDELSQIQEILALGTELKQHKSGLKLSKDEIELWLELVWQKSIPKSTLPSNVNVRILEKVAFTIYKNKELLERAERIRSLAKDIEDSSALVLNTWFANVNGDNQSLSNRREVVGHLHRQVIPLWKALDDVHRLFSTKYPRCALLCEIVDQDTILACKPRPIRIFYVTSPMDFQSGYSVASTWKEFEASGESLSSRLLDQAQGNEWFHHREVTIMRTNFSMIVQRMNSRPAEEKRRICADADLFCAKTTLAVADWVLRAWKTSWTIRICSCTLHYAQFEEHGVTRTLPGIVYHQRQHFDCRCAPAFGASRYLQLAILIFELALIRAVSQVPATPADGCQHFRLRDSSETYTRDQLLDLLLLERRAFYKSFRTAAEYCLSMSDTHDMSPEFAEESYHGYIEKVVVPLQRHYEVVKDHREKYQRRMDLESLAS